MKPFRDRNPFIRPVDKEVDRRLRRLESNPGLTDRDVMIDIPETEVPEVEGPDIEVYPYPPFEATQIGEIELWSDAALLLDWPTELLEQDVEFTWDEDNVCGYGTDALFLWYRGEGVYYQAAFDPTTWGDPNDGEVISIPGLYGEYSVPEPDEDPGPGWWQSWLDGIWLNYQAELPCIKTLFVGDYRVVIWYSPLEATDTEPAQLTRYRYIVYEAASDVAVGSGYLDPVGMTAWRSMSAFVGGDYIWFSGTVDNGDGTRTLKVSVVDADWESAEVPIADYTFAEPTTSPAGGHYFYVSELGQWFYDVEAETLLYRPNDLTSEWSSEDELVYDIDALHHTMTTAVLVPYEDAPLTAGVTTYGPNATAPSLGSSGLNGTGLSANYNQTWTDDYTRAAPVAFAAWNGASLIHTSGLALTWLKLYNSETNPQYSSYTFPIWEATGIWSGSAPLNISAAAQPTEVNYVVKASNVTALGHVALAIKTRGYTWANTGVTGAVPPSSEGDAEGTVYTKVGGTWRRGTPTGPSTYKVAILELTPTGF